MPTCAFVIAAVVFTAVSADETLRDGITVHDLVKGDCDKGIASHGDRISLLYVGYEGSDADPGKVFHSTASHTPFTFILGDDEVLSAFSEGVLKTCVDGKRRITLDAALTTDPPSLVKQGRMKDHNVPFGTTLIFDVEIISVLHRDSIEGVDSLMGKLRNRDNVSRAEFEFEHKKSKIPLNYVDVDSRTFMITAAFTGNHEVVEYLIENGVDPNHVMKTGLSALMYAAGEGHEKVVQALLKANATTTQTLHGGALGGYTALHFACLTGRLKMVELLLKAGADPKAQSHGGLTPWNIAKSLATDGKHAGIKRSDRMRCKRNLKELKALLKKYEDTESTTVDGKNDL